MPIDVGTSFPVYVKHMLTVAHGWKSGCLHCNLDELRGIIGGSTVILLVKLIIGLDFKIVTASDMYEPIKISEEKFFLYDTSQPEVTQL